MIEKVKYHVEEEAKSMKSKDENYGVEDERSVNYANIGIHDTKALKILK